MRKFGMLLILGGLVVIAAIGASMTPAPASAQLGSRHLVQRSTPGISAIVPTRAGVPAFTVDDVRHYLATHRFPGGRTSSGKEPEVIQIEFVTRELAEALMKGESLAEVPAGTTVCYAELRGPFPVQDMGAPLSLPPGAKVLVPQTGHMVFDARTGNLLVWGLMP